MWMCITEITLLYTVTTLIINCTPMQNKVKKKKNPASFLAWPKRKQKQQTNNPVPPQKTPLVSMWLILD